MFALCWQFVWIHLLTSERRHNHMRATSRYIRTLLLLLLFTVRSLTDQKMSRLRFLKGTQEKSLTVTKTLYNIIANFPSKSGEMT